MDVPFRRTAARPARLLAAVSHSARLARRAILGIALCLPAANCWGQSTGANSLPGSSLPQTYPNVSDAARGLQDLKNQFTPPANDFDNPVRPGNSSSAAPTGDPSRRVPIMSNPGRTNGGQGNSVNVRMEEVPPMPATPGADSPDAYYLKQKLVQPGKQLVLDKFPLKDALIAVSKQWGVNIVVNDNIEGEVSCIFNGSPLGEVLDALLLSHGYSYRPIGRSLVVMKLEQVGDVNPMFETAVISCGSSDAKSLADNAKILLSPRGKIQAMETANNLLVVDYPDRVNAVRNMVREMESPVEDSGSDATQTQVLDYHPQYVQVEFLKDSINTLLSRDQGRVAIMVPENRIVIVDSAARIALVKQLLEKIDVPRQQVRIMALIYDLSLQDIETLGLNWKNDAKAHPDATGAAQNLLTVDSTTYVPPATGDVSGAISLSNISQHFDIKAVMQAIAQCKDSRLLADPNVTVVENEKAKFAVVTEIPYQQLTQTQQGGSIGTTAFKQAGITLEVTPRIAQDETMFLDVNPSFSRLAGFTSTSQPILDKREVKATVRVANLQTLVIGGLRQRKDLGTFNGVVGLKDVKGLGKLFRSRSTEVDETELVVFIRPELITPFDIPKCRQQSAAGLADAMLDQVPIAVGPQPGHNGCQPGGSGTLCPKSSQGSTGWQDTPPGYAQWQGSYAAGCENGDCENGSCGPGTYNAAKVQKKDMFQGLAQANGNTRPTPSAAPPASVNAPSPPVVADGKKETKPGFWEKHFGGPNTPNATFVEKKPLRPDFNERYHEREMKFAKETPKPESQDKDKDQSTASNAPSKRATQVSWFDKLTGKKSGDNSTDQDVKQK
jgi:general secretion pathway protein D